MLYIKKRRGLKFVGTYFPKYRKVKSLFLKGLETKKEIDNPKYWKSDNKNNIVLSEQGIT